jgi:hypothetical protein
VPTLLPRGVLVHYIVTCWSWSRDNVVRLTLDGKVVWGLFKRSGRTQEQLQAACRAAFGGRAWRRLFRVGTEQLQAACRAAFGAGAEVVKFVLPWLYEATR